MVTNSARVTGAAQVQISVFIPYHNTQRDRIASNAVFWSHQRPLPGGFPDRQQTSTLQTARARAVNLCRIIVVHSFSINRNAVRQSGLSRAAFLAGR